MPQVFGIKEVKLRLFTRAPQRYLKDLPFILVIKDKRVLVSEEMSTNVSDNSNVDKMAAENFITPNNFPAKIINRIKSDTHACGCKMKESKLCKEHGRF